MNRIVLDASAILAIILGEPGHEKLPSALLTGAVASTVNIAEVMAKLIIAGWTSDEAWEDALSAIEEVVPFDEEQARIAGTLIMETRPLGLSLGDRACLSLGTVLKAPVYTADKAWKRLRLGISIHAIR